MENLPEKSRITRSAKRIVKARILQVQKLILRGYVHLDELIEEIEKIEALPEEKRIEMNWISINVGVKTLRKYIDRAMELSIKQKVEESEKLKNWIINAHFDIYKEARDTGKLQVAHRTLRELALLTGINKLKDIGKFRMDKFDVPLTEEEEAHYERQIQALVSYSLEDDNPGGKDE